MLPWLSDEELHDLTGYRRPSFQVQWLVSNRIKHYVNALNKVRVPRDALAALKAQATEKKTEPDFTKVRKVS